MIKKGLKNILRLNYKPFYFGHTKSGDKMICLLLILGSFMWGINVLVMKAMLEILPIYLTATLRVGLSLAIIFIIMKIKKVKFKKVDFKVVLKISLFALTINFILTFNGIAKISGTNNAIMNALAPLVTIILSFILIHKKISKKQIFAMSVAIIGFLWSIRFNFSNLSSGHLLLFLGLVSYSYASIVMQANPTDDYLAFTFSYLFLGFIQLLSLSLCFEGELIFKINQVPVLLWFLFILFSGVGFAYIQVVYLYAIKKIGSIKSSFFLSLNPIFTYLGSIVFLREKMDLNILIAFLLIVVALLFVNEKSSVDEL